MCITITSSRKFLPTLLIFKGNSKKYSNAISKFNDNIYISQNKKGWMMNSVLMETWTT